MLNLEIGEQTFLFLKQVKNICFIVFCLMAVSSQ